MIYGMKIINQGPFYTLSITAKMLGLPVPKSWQLKDEDRIADIISSDLFGKLRVYRINSPEVIKHVFKDNYKNYYKSKRLKSHAKEVFGRGLLFAEEDELFTFLNFCTRFILRIGS